MTAATPQRATALFNKADAILRGRPEGVDLEHRPARTLMSIVLCLIVFGAMAGSVVGSYGGFAGDRLWQVAASAAKVPFLLLATTLLSLPSFFVLNTLLGVRHDFPRVLRALVASQAGLTITLASLAPLTAFWYITSRDYASAILCNGFTFALASLGGQVHLRRTYRPLVASDARHRLLLVVWLFLYVGVGIQMAWVLRPFVGSPGAPFQLFRENSWGNAYEHILGLILRKLR